MTHLQESDGSAVSIARRVITEQAAAVLSAADLEADPVNRAVAYLRSGISGPGVITTGMGKSAYVAEKLAASLASVGTSTFFVHLADMVHGSLGSIRPGSAVVIVSKSSSGFEVETLLAQCSEIGARTIGVGSCDSDDVRSMYDSYIHVPSAPESDPYGLLPTTSTTTSLVVCDALLVATIESLEFSPRHFAGFHPAGELGWRTRTFVRDVMLTLEDVPVVDLNDSIREVGSKLADFHTGLAVVVDESGELVGVVTDGDIRNALAVLADPVGSPCSLITSENPLVVHGHQTVQEAVSLLDHHLPRPVSAAPVVEDSKLVGLITRTALRSPQARIEVN